MTIQRMNRIKGMMNNEILNIKKNMKIIVKKHEIPGQIWIFQEIILLSNIIGYWVTQLLLSNYMTQNEIVLSKKKNFFYSWKFLIFKRIWIHIHDSFSELFFSSVNFFYSSCILFSKIPLVLYQVLAPFPALLSAQVF